jgi:signal transduction histidine kinase
VLIVDDEREAAGEIMELLTSDSFMPCEITDDPFKALDIVEADRNISIIITDLKMPGMDGLQMIQKLRDRYNSNRDFAIIVITGHAGTEEAIKALQLGAMDFINKPISPELLLHAVSRASETLRLRRREIQFRQGLEHKVKERTREVSLLSDDLLSSNRKLRSLNLELSVSNRIKSEFLGMISHELRTPLNAILGLSELLAMASKERGDSEEHEYSNMISEAGFKLLSIVNMVLDLVDVNSGDLKLNIGEVHIEDVVGRVVGLLKPNAELSSIVLTTIKAESPIPMIQGDEKRLMQAISNIVDNSIRHSPSDTHVVVEVRDLVGEELSISVSDNGVGMTEMEVKAAREAFSQVEGGYTRSADGIGVGLTLANVFIELHGGRMNISSQKGEGTMVEMVIPGKSALPCQS